MPCIDLLQGFSVITFRVMGVRPQRGRGVVLSAASPATTALQALFAAITHAGDTPY